LDEARRLGEGKILVAFICDNGDRYLSKVFNDDWMRDMGYLGPAADLGTAQDVLDFKHQQVIFAEPDESIQTVVDRMVSMGISQMPMAVTPTDLRMVEEIDILRALASNEYTADDSVRQVSKPLEGQLAPSVGLNELQSEFEDNNVAVIVRDGTVLGVVNKIDVLEYMTHRTRAS
jgi:cystathionine beta-synthase